MIGGHPRRRVTRARSLYRRRRRRNVIVVEVVEEKFRRAARSTLTTLFYARPVAIVVDDVSSAVRLRRAPVGHVHAVHESDSRVQIYVTLAAGCSPGRSPGRRFARVRGDVSRW